MSESQSLIPELDAVERRISHHEAELKDLRALRTWLKKRPSRTNSQTLLDGLEEQKESES